MAHKIKYYIDENLDYAIAKGLRSRDIDVLTTAEANMRGKTDIEQLSFSRSEGRVIVTKDNDFVKLHIQGVPHGGIVYVSQQRSIGFIIHSLLLLHQVYNSDEMSQYLEYV